MQRGRESSDKTKPVAIARLIKSSELVYVRGPMQVGRSHADMDSLTVSITWVIGCKSALAHPMSV